MKNAPPTPSIKDKIAFFDNWIQSNMAVDPAVVRANVLKQTAPTSPIELPPLEPRPSLEQNSPTPSAAGLNYIDQSQPQVGISSLYTLLSGGNGLSFYDIEGTPDQSAQADTPVHPSEPGADRFNPPGADLNIDHGQPQVGIGTVYPLPDNGNGFSFYSPQVTPNRSAQADTPLRQSPTGPDGSQPPARQYDAVPDVEPPSRSEQAAASSEDSGTGLVGLPLGAKYVGEEKGQGWHAGKMHENKQVVTRHYDQNQKNDSKLEFDELGKATSADSLRLNNTVGFVVDPKTGDVHQFVEARRTIGDTSATTHHSSPLAGGDVAGAGKMTFSSGRLSKINDQSGHYKPGGMFTFQAVRAVNMANMTDEMKSKLRKTVSQTKAGGAAENADTIEQLIASEIQVKRIAFVEAMDAEQERLEVELDSLPEAEKQAAFTEMQRARAMRINEFQSVARGVEAELRKLSVALETGDGDREALTGSPLIDKTAAKPSRVDKLSPAIQKLVEAREVVRMSAENRRAKDPAADIDDLLAINRQLDSLLQREGYAPERNKETQVSLLGKSGMLSDDEYYEHYRKMQQVDKDPGSSDADKIKAKADLAAALNHISALKQLRQPLGEAAFAELLRGGKDKMAEAFEQNGLQPGTPGAVDTLKTLLGEQRVGKLTHEEVEEFSAKYKIAKSTTADPGPELFGFSVGKASQTTLTAQQFLQTGGNEGQIRTKARLLDEIKSISAQLQRGAGLTAVSADKIRAQLIAALKKKAKREELTETELQEIDAAVEKQLSVRDKAQQDMQSPGDVPKIDEQALIEALKAKNGGQEPSETERDLIKQLVAGRAESLEAELKKELERRDKEIDDLIVSTFEKPELRYGLLMKQMEEVERDISMKEYVVKAAERNSLYALEAAEAQVKIQELTITKQQLADELKNMG